MPEVGVDRNRTRPIVKRLARLARLFLCTTKVSQLRYPVMKMLEYCAFYCSAAFQEVKSA